jgi:hypothetical protein
MPADDDVRLCDFAIASNQMLIELQLVIWSVGYSHINKHPGASGELMLVSMQSAIATRQGAPMTASEIAVKLRMPYSNVKRQLDHLIADGRVKRVKRRYIHDLDRLDGYLKSRKTVDQAIAIMERCLIEYKRLRPLLDDCLE